MNKELMKYDEFVGHECYEDPSEDVMICRKCDGEYKRKNKGWHLKSKTHQAYVSSK